MTTPDKIPADIQRKIERDFPEAADQAKIVGLIQQVQQDFLNVGWEQLARALIIIADGDVKQIESIVNCGYHGDPRDILMWAAQISGNVHQYGTVPFE